MTNKNYSHYSNLITLTTACLALSALACTKSDSLGRAGDKDSGLDSGGTDTSAPGPEVPGTSLGTPDSGCQYALDSHLNAAGETVWSWRFHWQDPSPFSSCAAWGADAKMILEVDFPANPAGSGTALPTCSSDGLTTGAGAACAMANAWRFETACVDGVVMVELPSSNTFHGYYHLESSAFPNSPRNLVSQDVHCGRDLYLGAGMTSPPSIGSDGGVDTAPDGSACGAGSPVHYTAPGCDGDAVPICGSSSQDACTAVIPYCGCDGKTTIQGACGTSPSPYLYAGACKPDGGADTAPEVGGCGAGTLIHYAAPGCGAGAIATCAPVVDASFSPSSYCACDGVTTLTYDARGVRSPYLYAGACKPDGGVDAFSFDTGSIEARTTDLGVDNVPNPCAACTANQVCVQSFDGTCKMNGTTCKTITDACRTKLSASGAKSCTSLSECQSEFCSSPYQCVISSPCGTEAPQAGIYCYGP